MTGAELKKIRKASKLSREALSQVIFYSVKTIQNWENGASPVPSGMREQLMRMEIDVDTILKS